MSETRELAASHKDPQSVNLDEYGTAFATSNAGTYLYERVDTQVERLNNEKRVAYLSCLRRKKKNGALLIIILLLL